MSLREGRGSYEALAATNQPRLVTELPGPQASAVIASDASVVSPSLPRAYELAPARGAGAVIEDVDGNVFLDLNAAIAVTSTGHAHPAVVEAIQRQSERLLHYSASDFYLPIYAETCARLDEIAPMQGTTKSFLTNSGTEAVEAAVKLARFHTGRHYVIGFLGSFHGRSYGAVSLSASQAKYRAGFGPLLPGVVHAPYANRFSTTGEPGFDYLEEVVFKRLCSPDEVAAIVVEPVLGEGGYVIPPREWLHELRDLCDREGILLVADEVQSGMGRTGRMWAVEHFGIEPDILLTGKGLASGMPLGAMVARGDLMTWGPGTHGSTYGGNPVSCAAALATIELVEKELCANAADVGAWLLSELADVRQRQPSIQDVRGLVLMIGVEFADGEVADAVEAAAFRKGVLTLRAGDSTIRISPPLVIRREQAASGVRLFEEACAEVASFPSW